MKLQVSMSGERISKEEKAFIKAYVNLCQSKLYAYAGLDEDDASWLENECTKIIGNRSSAYRCLVEDFIAEYINKNIVERGI